MGKSMTNEDFNIVLERRIELMRSVLAKKKEEYAAGGDRLANFNRASAMLQITPEAALVGMLAKHIVSILDIVDNCGQGKFPSVEMIEEKLGDYCAYGVLLEAMLKNEIEELQPKAEEKGGTCRKCMKTGVTIDINGLCIHCHDARQATTEE